ncbi:MAG: FAD binding domain-containing protein [Xanthobacteraceae bacterium]
MKPAPFDYHAPESLAEATALLSRLDNAKILAGGQSLVPMMNFRYVMADHVVDLARVEGLAGITVADGKLRIGAMTRQRELEFSAEIAKHCPLMRAALAHVGHRQTRNRGTIGGSLVHADPAAELPAVCVAHAATIEIAGSGGTRRVPMREFNQGFMATAIEPDEILVAVELPIWPAGHGYGFHEFVRRHGDFAIAGAAALLEVQHSLVRRVSLTLFGVTATPARIAAVETMLAGKRLDAATLRAAAAETAAIEPIDDIHAGADYRRHLAQVLTVRALTDAAKRAGIAI